MPNTRISNLATGGAVAANDRFVAVETAGIGPVTKTGAQLKNWAAVATLDPLGLAQYDNVADCTTALQAAIDSCFGPAGSPNGSSAWLNKPFILPPGRFNISAPLNLIQAMGGIISGAGRFATRITQTTPGASIFVTNGFEFNTVGNMLLVNAANGVAFDLDWDNNGLALQSNTFFNIRFQDGDYGLRIGWTGFMGSETLVENCFFNGNAISGLSTQCFNALQTTVIGGNFSFCGRGIDIYAGGVPSIIGVGFQANTDYDIYINASAHIGMVVSGCRTESVNFILCGAAPSVSLHNCTQRNANPGEFAHINNGIFVDGCWSDNGQIVGGAFSFAQVRNSGFGRVDYLDTHTGSLLVDGQPRSYPITGNYTLGYSDRLGAKIDATSSSAVNITVPADILDPGVVIEVAQLGTGQVTLVPQTGTARTNLLFNSTALTASSWILNVATRSNSTIFTPGNHVMIELAVPTGLHSNGANFFNAPAITLTANETISISIYAQKTNHNYVAVTLGADTVNNYVVAVFDLLTGAATQTAVGSGSGTLIGTSITDEGGGTYRVGFTGSFSQTGAYASFGFAGAATGNTFDGFGNPIFTAIGTETVLFGDTQMEPGSNVTAFIPTTTTPVTVGQATIHTPRSLTTRAQYSTIAIRQRALNDWIASGDLT